MVAKKKRRIGARVVSLSRLVSDALGAAVERGIRRHNKYAEMPLTGNLDLLASEIEASFWLWLDDNSIELYWSEGVDVAAVKEK
jgi:hypothetical protein